MARKDSEQQLSTLIINKVDSEDTFQEMVDGDLVNDDELYLVEGEGSDLGLSVINGLLCMTYDSEYSTYLSGEAKFYGPVFLTQKDGVLSATWQEICNNMNNNIIQYIINKEISGDYVSMELQMVVDVASYDDNGVIKYEVTTNILSQTGGMYSWYATTANDYPVVDD